MKLRSEYKDAFLEKHGVKLGLMSGFVKVTISVMVFFYFMVQIVKYWTHYLLQFLLFFCRLQLVDFSTSQLLMLSLMERTSYTGSILISVLLLVPQRFVYYLSYFF